MNDIESRRITLSSTAIQTVCLMTGLDPDCKSHTLGSMVEKLLFRLEFLENGGSFKPIQAAQQQASSTANKPALDTMKRSFGKAS
jgi:hypothetical protein